ncbi:pentatricopeptide repeat-containing protein At3g51320-like [Lotus japonicus]|uniref:pentatricopeptide repeat-containing protein At3g51320-like n=1 Tax=Lotus japonicus TaxID=34305 RepID=UPI00258CD07D|nr:pentatricopeptide repeat-containing protein At3g51320-like [Lotus japonicus]
MARVSTRQLLPFRTTLHPRPTTTTTVTHTLPNTTPPPPSETDGKPPPFTRHHFQTLLQSSCQTPRHLLQIQALLITTTLARIPFLARTLLSRASNLCGVDFTLLIFRYFNNPLDTFCVNTVISAYCKSHDPHLAQVFYFRSLRFRFFPNSYTFVPLIGSCGNTGCIVSGRKCHAQVIKNGFDSVLPVQNSLIHMYADCGDVQVARVLFDSMLARDLASWNSMVDGYLEAGDLSSAHALFDVMPDKNLVTWNIMISGFLKARNPGYALKLFREMGSVGLKGNATTMVCVVTACGRSARLKEGRSVHGSIIRMFSRSSLILDTALIDMYCKCRRVELATRVFERMTNRNLVSWNAMILGHCIHGSPEDGLSLFDEMVGMDKVKGEVEIDESPCADRGVVRLQPDEVTFIGILCACARAELLAEGRSYFKQMTDVFGLKPNFAHLWCMANLLANAGLVDEAEKCLRNMAKFDGDMSRESAEKCLRNMAILHRKCLMASKEGRIRTLPSNSPTDPRAPSSIVSLECSVK